MKSAPYDRYWELKRLKSASLPQFPVKRWWASDELCEIEALYFKAIREARIVLDYGAGDLRIRDKFRAAGYAGVYETLDISDEYAYTYSDPSQLSQKYDAVLCLDVLEHLPLNEGVNLVHKLANLLNAGGTLILQTANARCIRHPSSWDMTHLHCYNAADIWALLHSEGLDVTVYRVVFGQRFVPIRHRARQLVANYMITQLLGCDYADNIAAIARRPA